MSTGGACTSFPDIFPIETLNGPAIARAHGLTLVTHNTREFGRVSGLRLEDWQ